MSAAEYHAQMEAAEASLHRLTSALKTLRDLRIGPAHPTAAIGMAEVMARGEVAVKRLGDLATTVQAAGAERLAEIRRAEAEASPNG